MDAVDLPVRLPMRAGAGPETSAACLKVFVQKPCRAGVGAEKISQVAVARLLCLPVHRCLPYRQSQIRVSFFLFLPPVGFVRIHEIALAVV